MKGGKGQGARGKLRSGFTTGACAAAAAKAATLLITRHLSLVTEVEIPFPDGSRHKFKIQDSAFRIEGSTAVATASVIKDAGDDPDVTNGAEIAATVEVRSQKSEIRSEQFENISLIIKGGKGVGIVTKPGLPVPVGEAAINPVPRQMIKEAVREAIEDSYKLQDPTPYTLHPTRCPLEITISVPMGEELAKKTLNSRLGITGGISILGTTGIVKPISTEAWTATISSSMDVAKAMGHREIVISAGRSSEKAHLKKYNLSEECYVLMGDYLEFSLREAKKHGFKKIHLCAQWAKMVKIAMATPQTHVRFGAIDIKKAVEFLQNLNLELRVMSYEFNTAREIFDLINSRPRSLTPNPFTGVCNAARKYAEVITEGLPVSTHLVSYEGEIIASSE
ncbi:MAG: cobalamin biosynthesis protein CbiD [Nitrospiraceae bacterium]|nr:MAG: cobalamin biosynthesis protein CbiD [Nitrospiraceae bacterium]